MTEYYEEKVLRYRVYKRPTLKLEDGSKYPWSLEWSFYSRVHAEEKLEIRLYRKLCI